KTRHLRDQILFVPGMEAPVDTATAGMALGDVETDDPPERGGRRNRSRNEVPVPRRSERRVPELDVQHGCLVQPQGAGTQDVVRACNRTAVMSERCDSLLNLLCPD